MIESAANENVLVVAMKNLFVVGDFAFDVFGKYSCFVAFVFFCLMFQSAAKEVCCHELLYTITLYYIIL